MTAISATDGDTLAAPEALAEIPAIAIAAADAIAPATPVAVAAIPEIASEGAEQEAVAGETEGVKKTNGNG